ESRHMTAMFTDVKGFSTISEKLTPEQLVSLLNAYLTGMSDIILDEEGVVDKYEGDAIIAFWGAPTPLENHAYHALASAIKMKKVEAELNKTFREKQMSPTDLLSRFGINTGEMVAGNMGTQRKMNYTIMGNAVNLAARLEGVNKMYGTWILTTDYTAKEAGDAFEYRKLDRVRVVGINTPVQLLEVVCFKEDLQEDKKKFLADYETAYTLFEQRQWKKAEALFTSLKSRDDTDGPVNLYLKRCKDFIQNPPAVDWDGVFNMTQK
ncbi:MAG TPA: adenylate/guanylate cyclase domain-containing protein, partial [Treponemataceae bacterium]|nr:adenylate/guanylate cyclase domain-containing protein [Treponemataceae bacterium]